MVTVAITATMAACADTTVITWNRGHHSYYWVMNTTGPTRWWPLYSSVCYDTPRSSSRCSKSGCGSGKGGKSGSKQI